MSEKELSAKQKAAAALIALYGSGDTFTAQQVGVHRATINRWRQNSTFMELVGQLAEARNDAIKLGREQALEKLAAAGSKAIETMSAALEAMHTVGGAQGVQEEDWANRLRAAEDIAKGNELGGFGRPQPAGQAQAAAVVQVVISPEVMERAQKELGGTITILATEPEEEN